MEKITEEDFLKATEEASKVFGVDPAYFGEAGDEEVFRQLKKLGYTDEDLKVLSRRKKYEDE